MNKEVKSFIRTFSIIFPIGAVLVLTYGYFNGNFDSEIPGCMDSKMSNYNPEATIDDGSCISALYGCTETTAINYNSEANTDDGSCIQRSEAMKNDRETKEQLVDNTSNFKGKEVERPLYWGGYCIMPNSIEFWQGRPSRLHDRLLYEFDGESWNKKRLAP